MESLVVRQKREKVKEMMKSEEGDGFEEDDLIRRMPIDEEETLAGCHTKDATHCEVHTVYYTVGITNRRK